MTIQVAAYSCSSGFRTSTARRIDRRVQLELGARVGDPVREPAQVFGLELRGPFQMVLPRLGPAGPEDVLPFAVHVVQLADESLVRDRAPRRWVQHAESLGSRG